MTEDSIKQALTFISRQQLSSGNFESYSSPDRYDFSTGLAYQTSFTASLMLAALQTTVQTLGQPIRSGLASYLLSQKSKDWSFNYWDKASPQYKALPYPDDLDDTACAISALQNYDAQLIKGAPLAAIAKLLIANEKATGGPYFTWIGANKLATIWQDVDIAVNANIGYVLAQQQVELPKLTALIETAISASKLQSPYYPDDYPLIYFISRWYQGDYKQLLIDRLLDRRHAATWDTPLHSALAISSLCRLGADKRQIRPAVAHLIAQQSADGSWPAAAFCIDPAIAGTSHYSGSAALTTAFCVEALELTQTPLSASKPKLATITRYYQTAYQQTVAAIEGCGSESLAISLQTLLDKTTDSNAGKQIILLPWLTRAAYDLHTSNQHLQQLTQANIFGWMAYSVFDDFMDGTGEADLLPAAVFSLRQTVTGLGHTMPANKAFQKEVAHILNLIDAANAWELQYCRATVQGNRLQVLALPDYGDYWQLANRSLGHTIAGLGVLYAAGHDQQSVRLKTLRSFFYHYLIARQLHDDAHDWEADLAAGHINAVATQILARWQAMPQYCYRKYLHLQRDRQILRTIMWQQTIDSVCQQIQSHSMAARRALQTIASERRHYFEALLEPLETGAKQALHERDTALAFIQEL